MNIKEEKFSCLHEVCNAALFASPTYIKLIMKSFEMYDLHPT